MKPAFVYWTPVDLLVHQDCDRELANRIAHRSHSWRDPVLDVVGDARQDVLAVLTAHAAAVRAGLVAGVGLGPDEVVTLGTSHADETLFAGAALKTAHALASDVSVIEGAAFESAAFRGAADLVFASENGWVLADSRLAAVAPAHAAVMLVALGAQLESAGHRVADHVLVLGDRGERRRWSRPRLHAVIEHRAERVRAIAAPADRDESVQRVCDACKDQDAVLDAVPGAGDAVPLVQPAIRFPASRPDDLFLHVEHVPSALGSDGPQVVLAAGSVSGVQVWWGEDRSHQMAHALDLLDRVRHGLARDKKLHVFHRGVGVVRHLLRMTAGEPEAAHFLSVLLGGRTGRVLIDIGDAIDSLGLELSPPTAGTEALLSRAALTAERLGDRDAARDLRQHVVSALEARCTELRALRDGVLDVVGGATGAGVALPPFTASPVDDLARSLRVRAGSTEVGRDADEMACAVVASALGYFDRERREFERREQRWLSHPVNVWSGDPGVLVFVDAPEVTRGLSVLEGHRNSTRGLQAIANDHGNLRVRPGRMRVLGRRGGQPGVARHLNTVIGECVVREVDRLDDGRVRVSFDEQEGDPRAPHPIALIPLEPPDDFYPFRAVHDLATSMTATDTLPRTAVVDLLVRRPPRLVSGLPLPRSSRLGADLVAALQDLDDSYIAVQGPPGTGKTRLGASAVRRLVYGGWKVGVVAQSHAAVEHFLDTAIKHGLDPELVAKSARKGVRRPGSWRTVKDIASHVRASDDGCLVGGTVWTFTNPMVSAACLDLLVVEEAGQLSLAHTIAAARASRNLLFLGDPQQLPGVSEGVHDEPVDSSPLEWLNQGSSVIPDSFGYFLPKSFRMSPGLCERVSELSYDGYLRSDESAAQRNLAGFDSGVLRVEVEHTGNAAASLEEAHEVVRRVKGLLGTKWLDPAKYEYAVGLGEEDFLVVAPFNAQVNLIRDTLTKAGLPRVRVGTVDKFQGQEAPVVFLSMASSKLDLSPRSADFLLDRRRLNVAISRAQWMAVVICSTDLAHMLPEQVNSLQALTAFVGTANRVERLVP